MRAGEITSINQVITENLNIRQLAQDAIEQCEGPELLRAFWQTLAGRIPERSNETFQLGLSVLDPTCGSGAFLFAALNIFQPLYEACLLRMRGFVEELSGPGTHGPEKYRDFRRTLEQVDAHPNQTYYVLKTIILTNLYGVDIMREAVEICKLRLFLTLVAQVEPDGDAENLGIEPLPDIDLNIRAGNTLVGFTSLEEVRRAMTFDAASGNYRMLSAEDEATLARIEESAELADRAYQRFRQMQTNGGMESVDFRSTKWELQRRLDDLSAQLSTWLVLCHAQSEG